MATINDLAHSIAGRNSELESDLISHLIMETTLSEPVVAAIRQELQREAHKIRQRKRRQRRAQNLSSFESPDHEQRRFHRVEAISLNTPDLIAVGHELESEIHSIPKTPLERDYVHMLFGQDATAHSRSGIVKALSSPSKSSAYRQTGRVDSEIHRLLETR